MDASYKDTDLAWCAGIIDGEGSICIVKNRKTYRLVLQIRMCHLETVRKVKSILKVGNISNNLSPKESKANDSYDYHISGPDVITVLNLVKSYLFTKKSQALLALEYGEKCIIKREYGKSLSVDVQVMREILAEEIKILNKRGR